MEEKPHYHRSIFEEQSDENNQSRANADLEGFLAVSQMCGDRSQATDGVPTSMIRRRQPVNNANEDLGERWLHTF